MNSLHPTVWRTCRVVANEVRLKLLWRLFEFGVGSVGQLAETVGVAESTASSGLRALNARGLLIPERRGPYIYYRAVANPEVEHAELLLEALRDSYEKVVPFAYVMRVATAFTHARRIEIVRILNEVKMDEATLSIQSQISVPALQRHLRKLIDRGFVVKNNGIIELVEPSDQLSRAFLKAVLGN